MFRTVIIILCYIEQIAVNYPSAVNGHGRLMDPPARNAMWRFGFPNPVNYNDNELFCGGYAGMLYIITDEERIQKILPYC